MHRKYIGLAGWSDAISKKKDIFLSSGSSLEKYSRVFNSVEINASFYRSFKRDTYEKWKNTVPEDFLFSVKMNRNITHFSKLQNPDLLDLFLTEISGLGHKLGVILIQLPPSLTYNKEIASYFFSELRSQYQGTIVCEPRHISWETQEANQLLIDCKISRVASDPSKIGDGEQPAGDLRTIYYRLHGSPKLFYSSYSGDYLDSLYHTINRLYKDSEVWVIFNNTASVAGIENALYLKSLSIHE